MEVTQIIENAKHNKNLYSEKELAIISAMCDVGAGIAAYNKVFNLLETKKVSEYVTDKEKIIILEATSDVINIISCYIPSCVYAIYEHLSPKYLTEENIQSFSVKTLSSEGMIIVKSYLENILLINKIHPIIIAQITNQACSGFLEHILNIFEEI